MRIEKINEDEETVNCATGIIDSNPCKDMSTILVKTRAVG